MYMARKKLIRDEFSAISSLDRGAGEATPS